MPKHPTSDRAEFERQCAGLALTQVLNLATDQDAYDQLRTQIDEAAPNGIIRLVHGYEILIAVLLGMLTGDDTNRREAIQRLAESVRQNLSSKKFELDMTCDELTEGLDDENGE